MLLIQERNYNREKDRKIDGEKDREIVRPCFQPKQIPNAVVQGARTTFPNVVV